MIRGELPPVLLQKKRRAQWRNAIKSSPPPDPPYSERFTYGTHALPTHPPLPLEYHHSLEIPGSAANASTPPYVGPSSDGHHSPIPTTSPPLSPTITIHHAPSPQSASPTPPSPSPPTAATTTTINITVTGPTQPCRFVVSLEPISPPTTPPPPAEQPSSGIHAAEPHYVSVEPYYADLWDDSSSGHHNKGSAPTSPTLPAFPAPMRRTVSSASHNTSSLSSPTPPSTSSPAAASSASVASRASYYLRPIDREFYEDSNDGKLIVPPRALQTSSSMSMDSKRCSNNNKLRPEQLQLLYPPSVQAPEPPTTATTIEQQQQQQQRCPDGVVKKTLLQRARHVIANSIVGSSRGDYGDADAVAEVVGRDAIDGNGHDTGKDAYLYDYVRTFPVPCPPRPRLPSPEPEARSAPAPIDNVVYFTESENGYFPMGLPIAAAATVTTADKIAPKAEIPPELPPRQYLRYRTAESCGVHSNAQHHQPECSSRRQLQYRSVSAPDGISNGYSIIGSTSDSSSGGSSRTRKHSMSRQLLAWVRRRTRSAHK